MSNEATSWHAQRRRAILRAHPEVKALYGPHRSTALWVVALTLLNATLQIACASRPWWQVIALAWIAGAIIVHGQFMLIHELGHSLVFRSLWANNVFALIANLTLGAPGGIAFRRQHALHHQHLGEGRAREGRDTQSPTYDEAVRVGHAWYRKLPHFVFGRFYFKPRPATVVPTSAWTVANAVLSIGWVIFVVALFGPKPLVYGAVSMIASVGPHPLGGRRLSEHLTWRRSQPTISYYGPLDPLVFHQGHHVEHHDFPNIPWRNLPKLRALAPEFYRDLYSVPSWGGLLLSYFFDARYSATHYLGLSEEWLEELLGTSRAPRRRAS